MDDPDAMLPDEVRYPPLPDLELDELDLVDADDGVPLERASGPSDG